MITRRVGGSTYQVPMEVSEDRGIGHAMNWIIQFSRSRKGKSMVQNLSQELTDDALPWVLLQRNEMILTRWQSQTKHLLILGGKNMAGKDFKKIKKY